MSRGDHLKVSRGAYTHHGIDAGGGEVIHFAGEPLRRRHCQVEVTDTAHFCRGGAPEVVASPPPGEVEAVLERARGQIGRTGYSVIFDNCEHFAHWCLTGSHRSRQVDLWTRGAGLAGSAALTGARLLARRGSSRILARTLGPVGGLLAAGSAIVSTVSWFQRRRRSHADEAKKG